MQQKLMRHAQVSTTMNIYGNALMGPKREANSKGGQDGTEERKTVKKTLQTPPAFSRRLTGWVILG